MRVHWGVHAPPSQHIRQSAPRCLASAAWRQPIGGHVAVDRPSHVHRSRERQHQQGQPLQQQQQQPQQDKVLDAPHSSAPDTRAAHVTNMITWCRTVQHLQGLVRQHQYQLNPIHVGAVLSKLAKLCSSHNTTVADHSGSRVLLQQLMPLFESQLERMGPRVLANSIWALAKLGHVPSQHVIHRLWLPLTRAIPHMLPQQLSSLLWAFASWYKQLSEQQQLSQAWEMQVVRGRVLLEQPEEEAVGVALGMSAAAAAAAASGLLGSLQGAAAAAAAAPEQVQQPMPTAAGPPTAPPLPDSSSSSASEAHHAAQPMVVDSNSSSGSGSSRSGGQAVIGDPVLLQLGLTPTRLQLLQDVTASRLKDFSTQALSNTLYAWAVLGAPPSQPWCDLYWSVSSSCMAHFEPQHISNTVWAVATLQLQPPKPWVGSWWAASQKLLGTSTPQGCSNMLWAVAKLGWPVPAGWATAFAEVTRPRLAHWPEQALTNCCWAWGTLAKVPASGGASSRDTSSQEATDGEQGHPHGSKDSSSNSQEATGSEQGHLHGSKDSTSSSQQHGDSDSSEQQVVSCTAVRQLLEETGWAGAVVTATYHSLRRLSAQQLANTLWGFSCMGLLPPEPWLDTFFTVTAPKLRSCLPEELSNILVGVARLQLQPGAPWLAVWEAAAAQALHLFHAYHLANVAWALVHMGHVPSATWQQRYLREAALRLRASLPPAPERAAPAAAAAVVAATSPPRQGLQQQQQQQSNSQPVPHAAGTAAVAGGSPGAAVRFREPSAPPQQQPTMAPPNAATAAHAAAGQPPGSQGPSLAGGLWAAASPAGTLPDTDSKWLFDSRGIAILAWAVAKQGWQLPPKFWHLLQLAALQLLSSFSLQGAMLLLWSLAAAQQQAAQGLLDGVLGLAGRQMAQLQSELRAARVTTQQQQQQQQGPRKQQARQSKQRQRRHQQQEHQQAQQLWLASPEELRQLERRRVQLVNDVVMLLWSSAQLGGAPAAEVLLPVVGWAQSQLSVLLYRCRQQGQLQALSQGPVGGVRAAAAQDVAGRAGMSIPLVRKQLQMVMRGGAAGGGDAAAAGGVGGSAAAVGAASRRASPRGSMRVQATHAPLQTASTQSAAVLGSMVQSPVLAASARWSVMLLSSLGALGFHPGTQQLKPWYRWSAGALLLLTPRDLAQVMWSCVVLGEVPPRAWLMQWQQAWQSSRQQLPVLQEDLELLGDALALVRGMHQQRLKAPSDHEEEQQQQQQATQASAATQGGAGAGDMASMDASEVQPSGQQGEPAMVQLQEVDWSALWHGARSLRQRCRALEQLLQHSISYTV